MAISWDIWRRIAELQEDFSLLGHHIEPVLSIEDILPKKQLCIMPDDLRSIIARAQQGERRVIEIEPGKYEVVKLPNKHVIAAKVDAAAKSFIEEMVRLGLFESQSEAIRVAIYLLREVLEKAIQQRREMLEQMQEEMQGGEES